MERIVCTDNLKGVLYGTLGSCGFTVLGVGEAIGDRSKLTCGNLRLNGSYVDFRKGDSLVYLNVLDRECGTCCDLNLIFNRLVCRLAYKSAVEGILRIYLLGNGFATGFLNGCAVFLKYGFSFVINLSILVLVGDGSVCALNYGFLVYKLCESVLGENIVVRILVKVLSYCLCKSVRVGVKTHLKTCLRSDIGVLSLVS